MPNPKSRRTAPRNFAAAILTTAMSLIAFGVFLHGLAGDIAYEAGSEAPLMASDLIRAIPHAYKQFYAECGRV